MVGAITKPIRADKDVEVAVIGQPIGDLVAYRDALLLACLEWARRHKDAGMPLGIVAAGIGFHAKPAGTSRGDASISKVAIDGAAVLEGKLPDCVV
jgi:hypothetical protein